MKELIGAAVLFLISALAFLLSVRSFQEKGFLLNNAYLYASRQERENMDKKPHYRQSAIVFLLLGCIFFLNGLQVLLSATWIFYAVMVLVIVTLGYAIVSGIRLK
jgi:fatty acid desaturase